MQWDMVIGLEVHAQLITRSKLFSNGSTAYGAPANTQTTYVDAGLPGTLPVMNREALHKAIRLGLAIDAEINPASWFDRKNYFYPDLPKGYQISQLQSPLIQHGHLDIPLSDGRTKTIPIARAHLEEDAGKSIHTAHIAYTGIDLNRAGTPLLEIVTAPCMQSAEEAISYLKTLHQLVRFLGICDGNMQEGSFRCDVNISLKPAGSDTLGTRTELKNLNSFRFIDKAIAYEYQRHKKLLEQGASLIQETRLYDPDRNCTRSMRTKEEENDYRYFPDPDLLTLHVDAAMIESVKSQMPPLPSVIKDKLRSETELDETDIDFLLSSPDHYAFYKAVSESVKAADKLIANWLKGPYSALLKESKTSFAKPPVDAKSLAILLQALSENKISTNAARKIFQECPEQTESIKERIETESANRIQDHTEIDNLVRSCLEHHPEQVAQYKAGKTKLLGFFVGQLMKTTKGKIDPTLLSERVKTLLIP